MDFLYGFYRIVRIPLNSMDFLGPHRRSGVVRTVWESAVHIPEWETVWVTRGYRDNTDRSGSDVTKDGAHYGTGVTLMMLIISRHCCDPVTRRLADTWDHLVSHAAFLWRWGSHTPDSFLSISELLDHAEGASTGFMVASGGVLSKGYGHDDMASALAMARRKPDDDRRKMDAETRCSGVCPHTWPDLTVAPIVHRYRGSICIFVNRRFS